MKFHDQDFTKQDIELSGNTSRLVAVANGIEPAGGHRRAIRRFSIRDAETHR